MTNQYNLLGVHGWASGTGWFSELFQKTSSGLVCSPYVWRRTKAYHKNILFCIQTVPTFSRFYADEVRGYPNGNYGYYYSVEL